MPKTLVDKVGLETLMQRLPEAYQRSLFASFVSFRYVFQYGVKASQVDFFRPSSIPPCRMSLADVLSRLLLELQERRSHQSMIQDAPSSFTNKHSPKVQRIPSSRVSRLIVYHSFQSR